MKLTAQQIFTKSCVLFSLLLVSRCCFADSTAESTSPGPWAILTNTPFQGLSLGARLVISEAADDSGSRTAITYVEFQNTNHSVNTVYVHSTFSLNCELRDSNGKVINPVIDPYNGLIPEPTWLALPFDSRLRCRPNPPAIWRALDGELLLAAGYSCWHIPRGDTNDYFLSGTLSLTVPKDETLPLPRHHSAAGNASDDSVLSYVCQGTLKLPQVKISAKSLSGK